MWEFWPHKHGAGLFSPSPASVKCRAPAPINRSVWVSRSPCTWAQPAESACSSSICAFLRKENFPSFDLTCSIMQTCGVEIGETLQIQQLFLLLTKKSSYFSIGAGRSTDNKMLLPWLFMPPSSYRLQILGADSHLAEPAHPKKEFSLFFFKFHHDSSFQYSFSFSLQGKCNSPFL